MLRAASALGVLSILAACAAPEGTASQAAGACAGLPTLGVERANNHPVRRQSSAAGPLQSLLTMDEYGRITWSRTGDGFFTNTPHDFSMPELPPAEIRVGTRWEGGPFRGVSAAGGVPGHSANVDGADLRRACEVTPEEPHVRGRMLTVRCQVTAPGGRAIRDETWQRLLWSAAEGRTCPLPVRYAATHHAPHFTQTWEIWVP